MESEQFFGDIETAVKDGKIVTFRWLANVLAMNSNEAKQLLFEYAQKKKSEVAVTYCVIGTSKSGRVVTITSEEKLDGVKSGMEKVTSVHVYSVQGTTPKDPNVLCATETQLKYAAYQTLCKTPELILERAKLGAFYIPVEVREKKPTVSSTAAPSAPPSAVKKELKKETKPTTKKTTKATPSTPTKTGAKRGNNLLNKLSQAPPGTPLQQSEMTALLGKRTTRTRPTAESPKETKKTKNEPEEEQPKRRLRRTGTRTDESSQESADWDVTMRSPSPVLDFSDSESEEESQEVDKKTEVPSPKLSAFNSFKSSPKSNKNRKTTTKESEDKGYFDEVEETDVPAPKASPKPAPKPAPKVSPKKKPAAKDSKQKQTSLTNFFRK